MAHRKTSVWLSRVLFESLLITISILAALALDEWREDRQDEEMIEHALDNFLREIHQNKNRIDDAAPFNSGLRDVLSQRQRGGEIGGIDGYVSMIESYAPGVLQSTAWETAIATGALAKMDYDLVAALSLTYSLQSRYQQAVRTGVTELTRPQNLADGSLDIAVFNAVRYLGELTRMETELTLVYDEAIAIIEQGRGQVVPADES